MTVIDQYNTSGDLPGRGVMSHDHLLAELDQAFNQVGFQSRETSVLYTKSVVTAKFSVIHIDSVYAVTVDYEPNALALCDHFFPEIFPGFYELLRSPGTGY